MDQEQISIDINTADEASLTKLQGVGTYLAKRIIEGRPFESIDDLTRVSGLSENDVERLRPFLSITGVSEGSPDLNLEDVVNQSDDIIEDEGEAVDEAIEFVPENESLDESSDIDQAQSLDVVTDSRELDEQEQMDLVEASSATQDDELPTIEEPEELPGNSEIDEQKPETAEDLELEPLPDDL